MKSLLSILTMMLCVSSLAQNTPDANAQMLNAIQSNDLESVRSLLIEGVHPRDVVDIYDYVGEKHALSFWRIAREKESMEIVELFNVYESTGKVPATSPRAPTPSPSSHHVPHPTNQYTEPTTQPAYQDWGCGFEYWCN